MTTTVLASSSPSRLSLLVDAGITPLVLSPGVDEEAVVAAAGPHRVDEEALLLARAKGEAVVERIRSGEAELPADTNGIVLIASDSILDLDGEPIGKPHTADRARRIWQRMGGRTVSLHTGHFVARLQRRPLDTVGPQHHRPATALVTETNHWAETDRCAEIASTRIHTGTPDARELDDYIGTGEPLEVAGALTIDGLGAAFVDGIDGDHTNVIGLSMPLLRRMTSRLGVRWTCLWDRDTPGNS